MADNKKHLYLIPHPYKGNALRLAYVASLRTSMGKTSLESYYTMHMRFIEDGVELGYDLFPHEVEKFLAKKFPDNETTRTLYG